MYYDSNLLCQRVADFHTKKSNAKTFTEKSFLRTWLLDVINNWQKWWIEWKSFEQSGTLLIELCIFDYMWEDAIIVPGWSCSLGKFVWLQWSDILGEAENANVLIFDQEIAVLQVQKLAWRCQALCLLERHFILCSTFLCFLYLSIILMSFHSSFFFWRSITLSLSFIYVCRMFISFSCIKIICPVGCAYTLFFKISRHHFAT